MLTRLSKSIVEWQIEKNIIKSGERATYQYAYELFLNQTITVLIAILIAILLRSPVPVFLFLLTYSPLRIYSGGYHANTHLGCTIVSSLLFVFVCLFMQYVEIGWIYTYYPAAFIVSGYFVLRYAPVPDRHKPLDEKEVFRYRKRSRIVWGVEVIFAVILYRMKIPYGLVIAIGHLILSLMLCLGTLKNRKYHVG